MTKNKNAKTNPKNKDGKCFQYALSVALNYEQIKKNPQIMSNIKPFIDQYNWKEIDFPLHKKNTEERLNWIIIVLHVPYNTEEIRRAYKSKYNLKCENEVVLLMITEKNDTIL